MYGISIFLNLKIISLLKLKTVQTVLSALDLYKKSYKITTEKHET